MPTRKPNGDSPQREAADDARSRDDDASSGDGDTRSRDGDARGDGDDVRGHGDDARGRGDDANGGGEETRDLFVFAAGGQLFAVFAEEVESVGENLRPAPLPFAPPTVLGVVPVRGRMRTALDPLRLLDAPAPPAPDAPQAAAADAPPAQSATPTQAAPPTQAPTPAPAPTKLQARLFVALAGDEQLALACDSAEGRVAVRAARLAAPPPDSPEHVRALLEHGGRAVTLLDPSRLFDAAMRGTDRRRRRS